MDEPRVMGLSGLMCGARPFGSPLHHENGWNHKDPGMTPFGRRVRDLRAQRGVTLTEMARAIGVTPTYLSALETGKRGKPTWALTQRIIAYFNVIWDEAEDLQRLAELSQPRVVVDTADLSPQATELANLLAREIGHLPQEAVAELLGRLKILRRRG